MKIRCLQYLFTALLCLTACAASAQEEGLDTFDYSYLKFDSVHNYYQSKSINLVSAEDPDLYFEAYAWLASPYHWGGKSKKGVDCSGFVSCVYNKLYGTELSGAVSDIFKKCDEILPSELKEGDFVFFNIRGHYLFHVGIYLQDGKFVHAAVHGGVMVSDLSEPYYKKYFYKAGRLKEEVE